MKAKTFQIGNTRIESTCAHLKVQSYKLSYNKYMASLTQITNTEIFVFIPVPAFKILRLKVLFIYRKDNRKC